MARDPASASAEYLAQFRTDIEAFITREAVESCVERGVFERAPLKIAKYIAFCDPSGGSSGSFTLAIAHKEQGRVVLDAIRESKPPFSPEAVVADFVTLLKHYRVSQIDGDRYAGEWPREQFRKQGIDYKPAEKPKSDLYLDMLPALNSRQVQLLDKSRLMEQFIGLERRTARSGKDTIDHRPGGHDDLANAVAGVVSALMAQTGGYDTSMKWVAGDRDGGRFTYAHYFAALGLLFR